MSSSSDDGNVVLDAPYSERDEWRDVKPIELDDGTNDIVRIAYTEVFKEVYGYLRAVLKNNEISERALELTKDAALLNPANYTVWYYRRFLLKALKKDLNEELKFITEVINDNPKNYQVWQHRRCMIDSLKDPSKELDFILNILKQDSKNYHAWQYRQYIIKTFNLWDDELNIIEHLIEKDVRNNSAWNQRYFHISNTNNVSDIKTINDELNYCKQKLLICMDNESVWNYLKAFVRNLDRYPQDFVNFCFEQYSSSKDDEKSPFLCSFLVDYHESEINEIIKNLSKNEGDEMKAKLSNHFSKAMELLDLLRTKYDIMREKYWVYIRDKMENKYKSYIN